MEATESLEEPTAIQHEQDEIARLMRELKELLNRPSKEVSKLAATAKVFEIAVLVEKQSDIQSFVFESVDPEIRRAAFQIVIGIIASWLQET
jgi:hypothetical protein